MNATINIGGFPEVLLTEGLCEMDVTTYVFWYTSESTKVLEERLNDVRYDNGGPCRQRDYQFLMFCAVIEERGRAEALGMVQFEKETHPHRCKRKNEAEVPLRKVFGPRSARFFHEIQDCNVNDVYLWLKNRGTGQIFDHGVFVGNWRMDGSIFSNTCICGQMLDDGDDDDDGSIFSNARVCGQMLDDDESI